MEFDKKRFSEFEKKENLFERTYNGVPYWQMLRFIACEGAYSDQIENSDEIAQNKKWERIKAYCFSLPWNLVATLVKHFRLGQYDVICFRHKTAPDLPARFFDYWKMPSMISTLYVDNIITPEMLKCTDVYNLILPTFVSKVKYSIKRRLNLLKEDREEDGFLRELEKKISNEFGRSISFERMKKEIVRWILYNGVYEKYYRKLFVRTGCKAIIVVCYYQNQLYSAYHVAREMGIKVIELQHGVINNHQEYWFEDQRGINNYTPDYFLAFGEAHISWTKMLPSTKTIAVGFPYQENQIEQLNNLKTNDKTVIIYPQSQPEFEFVLNEFANMANKKGYCILLKLHPLQAANPQLYYPILSENPNIEVISKQDRGIYYWLKSAKHHVMASTTVGLEAVALTHTNICIATFVPHQQTQPLLDWGVARGFATADELMKLVEEPYESDKYSAREALWKPNATENIQNFFRKLYEQNWFSSDKYRDELK